MVCIEAFKDAMPFLDVPSNNFAYWDILEASLDHVYLVNENSDHCNWERLWNINDE